MTALGEERGIARLPNYRRVRTDRWPSCKRDENYWIEGRIIEVKAGDLAAADMFASLTNYHRFLAPFTTNEGYGWAWVYQRIEDAGNLERLRSGSPVFTNKNFDWIDEDEAA